jgi:formiminotetrahydrofolate cyclodeaminase
MSTANFSHHTVAEFLAATAAKSPTPGGGAVASIVGALAAALAQMVVNYSAGKKSLAAHEPELRDSLGRLERARAVMLELAEEDAAAYGLVNELSKLSDGDERKQRELPAATRASVQVPMAVMAACVDLLRHFERLASITNRQLRSDLAIAAILAECTARASRWNIAVNVPFLPDESERTAAMQQTLAMVDESAALCKRVCAACEA